MNKIKPAALAALTAALAVNLLIGVGAVMVHARQAGDPPAAGNNEIGLVDLEKVYEASDAPGQLQQASAQIETDAQSKIDAMSAASQLSEAELKEYGDLVGLKAPDAKQKVRIDELRDFSDKRSQRLREVQQKPEATLTPEDKKLMSTGSQQKRQFDRMMNLLQQDVRQQVIEREETVKRGLVAQLRNEVSKVARDRKIQHVFDVGAMVCSTNDITAIVIQRVAKKAAPK